MLFFVAATMLSFSSCNKDESEDTADAPSTVAGTEWRWSYSNSTTGVIDVEVGFNGPMLAELIYTDMSTGIMQTDVLLGTYSYSNGKGTLALEDDTEGTRMNIPFTVSGTTLKLTFKGTAYTLTKK